MYFRDDIVSDITGVIVDENLQPHQDLSTFNAAGCSVSVMSFRQGDSSISLLDSTVDTAAAVCSTRHRHRNDLATSNIIASNSIRMEKSSVEANDHDSFCTTAIESNAVKSKQGKKHTSGIPREQKESCNITKPVHERRGAAKILPSVEVGDIAPDFELAGVMGVKHKLSSFRGRKVLLSFFRFAACHVCLYNIDMMKRQYDMLKEAGILIICIFSSTPENIARFASETLGDSLLALSDKKGAVYKSYKVKESSKSIVHAPIDSLVHWKKYKPYFNFGFVKDLSVNGMRVLPADFLINEDGIIVDIFRSDKPDNHHIPFQRLEAFIPEGRRCKCNKGDCISPKCRDNYDEQIRRESRILLGPKQNVRHTVA